MVSNLEAKGKRRLSFTEIRERLLAVDLPHADVVIGIGSGGIVPASLLAFRLGLPLQVLSINYRDPENSPRFDEPQLLSSFEGDFSQRTILLVDDVCVSGATMTKAKSLLEAQRVITFVLKGKADIVLFPEISACVHWPWKTEERLSLSP